MLIIEKMRKILPVITLLTLVILVGIVDPSFLSVRNFVQLLQDISMLFIMAMGITLVIYIGGIDLSSQSLASMATVLIVTTLPLFGFWGVILTLLIGFAFGAISGFLHVKLKIASFITTLAIGGVAYSTGQVISGQRGLYISGELRDSALGWAYKTTFGIPNEIVVSLGLLAVFLFLERRTTFGRSLKAIGAGELAAVASGIKVERIKIIAFALSGMLAVMAGIVLSARLAGGSPTAADMFLLPAIVAVLVGGTPLTGGVGGVLNTFIGALIVAVVRTGMVFLEVPATSQQIVFGVVLIIAIAATIDRSKVSIVK